MKLWLYLIITLLTTSLSSCVSEEATNDADGDLDQITEDGDSELSEAENQVDGDDTIADGDADFEPESDWAEGDISCQGVCKGDEPTVCIEGNLCVCDATLGELKEKNCDKICNDAGLGESSGCEFDNILGSYSCSCDIPSQSCEADIIINALPYTHEGSTSNDSNNFGLMESCFDWGVMGPDVIYSITLEKNNTIDISLKPQKNTSYDPSLIISASCSNLSVCLAGSDNKWSGEEEELQFTAPENGTYFIVVDSGYDIGTSESKGRYDLAIEGEMSAIEDGDDDNDADEIIDGDTEDEFPTDGDDDIAENSELEESETDIVENSDSEFEFEAEE